MDDHGQRERRTYIVGGLVDRQRAWCEANGVQPYARTTHMIGNNIRLIRGHQITDDDRLVIFGSLSEAMVEELMPALIYAPNNAQLVLNHIEATR